MRLLIIVPTYNERKNIEAVVEEFLRPVPGSELLIVDDASPDGTGELAEELALRNSRIHVVHGPGKRGIGPAYVQGFLWALDRNYDCICEMDADFSHDPKVLPKLLQAVVDGADMAIGSRYIGGGGTKDWGLLRRCISRGGGIYARKILGLPVMDPTSGFVCYRKQSLETALVQPLVSNGYCFQIEMKYRVFRQGGVLTEIPILFSDRVAGKSKMSPGIALEAMWKVWAIRKRYRPNDSIDIE